jgi:hypothetical protein
MSTFFFSTVEISARSLAVSKTELLVVDQAELFVAFEQ